MTSKRPTCPDHGDTAVSNVDHWTCVVCRAILRAIRSL